MVVVGLVLLVQCVLFVFKASLNNTNRFVMLIQAELSKATWEPHAEINTHSSDLFILSQDNPPYPFAILCNFYLTHTSNTLIFRNVGHMGIDIM
jgi:hypothetical protein